ncbi:NADH dehydrogenase (Ubiquinone) Fe-S protein 3 [Puccinia sorghi]|uniref:NADH dehydrogenase (Ubiquinone) Fe-S protein 3 n=1 Tax=Puccinia sorghi TaxID=27349 RepID=A0A0L6VM51_9BASI|nr:NADH dehydrogenase (Ubiquinone) Fe-S protein 3 [Puccinia sorghi]
MAATQSALRRIIGHEIGSTSVSVLPRVVGAPRSFSISAVSRLGNPPPMGPSPFKEPAGRNPAEAFADVYKDELTLYTAPSAIVPTLTFLRDHRQCQYKQLIDISGVDYPTRAKRFEVSRAQRLGGLQER